MKHCVVPETMEVHWKFQKQFIRENMKLNWKFKGGGRVDMKNLSWGKHGYLLEPHITNLV